VLVPVIPILITIGWLTVVTATVSACHVAARADAAEVEMYREARRKKTLRVRGGGGLGRGCSALPGCWLPCAARYPRRAGSGLAGEPLHRARRDVRCPGRVRTSGCRRQFMQTERAGRSMTTAREPLGLRALQLLAGNRMVSVLGGLSDGPIRPAELERGLPDAGHAVVIRRLRRLLRRLRRLLRRLRRLLHGELVSCERQFGLPPHPRSAAVPPRAYYSLTDAGRMLLEVTAEADRWERT
jgi:DNA-binding HxlR family transcriptional regulator